jgi:hypothetical protein
MKQTLKYRAGIKLRHGGNNAIYTPAYPAKWRQPAAGSEETAAPAGVALGIEKPAAKAAKK